MKKLLSVLLAAVFLLLFTACAADAGPAQMQLEPGNLSDEEKTLLSLVGAGQTASLMFEYRVDDTVKTVSVERYELDENGAWRSFGGGSFPVTGEEGRIALALEPKSNKMRFAVQDESGTSAIQSEYPMTNLAGLGIASTALNEATEIVLGEEIPLVIQILAGNDKEIFAYDVSEFSNPDSFAGHDYEHVYAVTVTFSGDELS